MKIIPIVDCIYSALLSFSFNYDVTTMLFKCFPTIISILLPCCFNVGLIFPQYLSIAMMIQCCANVVIEVFLFFPYYVIFLFEVCSNVASIWFQCCYNTITTMLQCWIDPFPKIFQYNSNFALMSFKCRFNTASSLLKICSNFLPRLFQYCTEIKLETKQIETNIVYNYDYSWTRISELLKNFPL